MTRRAAIIGAGIGGAAAALSLARRDWSVDLYEQSEVLGEVGAGIQIGPNGAHVLAALGVSTEAADEAQAVDMRDGRSGRRIAEVPFGATALVRYGAPSLVFHRADLLSALIEAGAGAGVRLHLGAEISRDAVPEVDLLVAADGVRSRFREGIAGPVRPRFMGQVAWRAMVPGEVDLDPTRVALFLGPGRHLVAYTLRQGAVWNVVAVEARQAWTAEGWNQAGDPEALRRAFSGWASPVSKLLGAAAEVKEWGLFAHGPLPRWHRESAVLLGDACHPMLPFLAQGATMAIEDAWVLATCLERAPIPEALAAYEAARKLRTARVQRGAARNAWIYHARGPFQAAIRAGIRARAALPGGLLSGLDWLYGSDVTR